MVRVIDYTEQGEVQLRVLVAMQYDKTTLAHVADQWKDKGLFSTSEANFIGRTCVKFFNRFGEAPKGELLTLVAQKLENGDGDQSRARLVDRLLFTMEEKNNQQPCDNSPYLIDLANKHFQTTLIRKTAEAAIANLANGDIDKAHAKMEEYGKVDIGQRPGIDMFIDEEPVRKIFRYELHDSLISFPGALGQFYGRSLHRGAFVNYLAEEKTGKSFMLMDLTYRAVCQRRKTAFFGVGDMTEDEMVERFVTRAAERPLTAKTIHLPNTIKTRTGDKPLVTTKATAFNKAMSEEEAIRCYHDVMRNKVKSKDPYCRLYFYPNDTCTVKTIASELEALQRRGFVADVCIAEGQRVLTNRGLVPIEEVRRSDRLWDGVDWVNHDGLVCKGVKDVITYAGLTATPEHLVWTEVGWRTLESCRDLRLRVPATGFDGQEIRLGQGGFVRCSREKGEIQIREGDASEVRVCPLCRVRRGEVVSVGQFNEWYRQGLSKLHAAETVSEMAVPKVRGCETAMHQSSQQVVEILRRERDRVSVPFRYGGMPLDHPRTWGVGTGQGIGSNRQRWTLRAGEPSVVNSRAEQFTHQSARGHAEDAQVPDAVPSCSICGRRDDSYVRSRNDPRTDRGKVGRMERQRTARVWDLLNAGPLHRFTVQGVLVHNCVVDYMDILATPAGYQNSPRDGINANWKQMRSLSQKYSVLVVTATQAKATPYEKTRMTKGHFADDKRKRGHVTGEVGIILHDNEKEDWQLFSLNWTGRRSERTNSSRCVWLASCLDIANPAVLSSF